MRNRKTTHGTVEELLLPGVEWRILPTDRMVLHWVRGRIRGGGNFRIPMECSIRDAASASNISRRRA